MDEYIVEVGTLVQGGQGLGKLPDGKIVFVPYVLPGERVRVRLRGQKSSFAQSDLVEVLNPSPDRIQPRCAHFGVCGGCHFQHMSYDYQAKIKIKVFNEALQRIAAFADVPIQEVKWSDAIWGYRNMAQFHLGPSGRLGFQAASSHKVIEIDECHIIHPAIKDVWRKIDLPRDLHMGRIEIRADTRNEVLVVLDGCDEILEFTIEDRISAVLMNQGVPIILAGDDHLVMEVNGEIFKVSAGSFFQVNTSQVEAMIRYLVGQLSIDPGMIWMDLYCGVGLFTKFLGKSAKRTIAVEVSSSACDDFVENLAEVENVELYVGTTEQILPGLKPGRIDLAVVDPPRAGMASRALEALINLQPQRVVYVSCNPSTLARDAEKLLQAGYRLASVALFDMFPHTFHIESISIFTL